MLRGLFGASARNAVMPAPDPMEGVPQVEAAAAPASVGSLRTPGPVNLERSYLGGLVRYQRPEGQSGADRMAIIGATLGDIGAALNGGQGGGLARVQEQYRARQKEAEAKSLMERLYPDDPDAGAILDLDPSAASRAWLESKKPDEWHHVEAEDGLYLYNPKTQETKKVASWTRKADDPVYQEYLRSQIFANQALAGQRQNQGAYYGAKAKQPYAPQRPRAGRTGGGGDPAAAPPGWR